VNKIRKIEVEMIQVKVKLKAKLKLKRREYHYQHGSGYHKFLITIILIPTMKLSGYNRKRCA